MKITKSQLKKLIKEEFKNTLQEESAEAFSLDIDSLAEYVWVRPRRSDAKMLIDRVKEIHEERLSRIGDDPDQRNYSIPRLPRGYWGLNNGNFSLVVLRGDLADPKYIPLVNYVDMREEEYEGELNSRALGNKIRSMLKNANFVDEDLPAPMSNKNMRAMGYIK